MHIETYLHTFQDLQEEMEGVLPCVEHWPARNPFPFFLSSQEGDGHVGSSRALHHMGRILQAFGEDCTDQITRKSKCLWGRIVSKHVVTCVKFPGIFLLLFLHTKRAQARSLCLFFWIRCACSAKDTLIIPGNQQSTLQGKMWSNKVDKRNSNQKI